MASTCRSRRSARQIQHYYEGVVRVQHYEGVVGFEGDNNGSSTGMRKNSATSSSRRRGSGNLGPGTTAVAQGGESSALDLAELLEKKDLSAAEVMVIRQNMVQVRRCTAVYSSMCVWHVMSGSWTMTYICI